MKDTFVDVKATLDNGSQVIIEMQVLNHEGLEKRILYNAAKNYSTQLKKGQSLSAVKSGHSLDDYRLHHVQEQ